MALKVYFNNVAPADFSPEGFEPDVSEQPDAFAFHKTQRVRINLGGTATHHDALKVYLQTYQVRARWRLVAKYMAVPSLNFPVYTNVSLISNQSLFGGEPEGSPVAQIQQAADKHLRLSETEPTMGGAVTHDDQDPELTQVPSQHNDRAHDPFGFSEAENVDLANRMSAVKGSMAGKQLTVCILYLDIGPRGQIRGKHAVATAPVAASQKGKGGKRRPQATNAANDSSFDFNASQEVSGSKETGEPLVLVKAATRQLIHIPSAPPTTPPSSFKCQESQAAKRAHVTKKPLRVTTGRK